MGNTVKTEEKAIVEYKGEKIPITFRDVKNLICPLASDQETALFLKTCQSLQLNPFEHEIYLIKYSEKDRAAIVIAIDSYLKAGEINPQFDGYEAGIILDFGGRLEFREGAFLLDKERTQLVGGWAKVYRKDRTRPFYVAVNKKECLRYRKDGTLTEFWTEEKQPSMLRKVALKRALVEAFPSLFSGTISNVDYEAISNEVKLPEAKGETPQGELPPALEKNGKPDWRKFWARVKSELGLTTEQARLLLQVDSIKEELLNQGWTMERIWDELVAALQKENAKPEPQRIVDVKTGEVITQDEDLFGEGETGAAALAAPANIAMPETGVETKLAPERKPAPSQSPAPAKPKRDPETIKTIAELYKVCHEDFKLQPKDVLKELGYSSQADITELPSECYRKILAVRT
jgi:phage recombination protein Bet